MGTNRNLMKVIPIEEKEQEKSEVIRDGYTRVTEILWPFSGITDVPEEIVANAGRRGTLVHNECESIIKGLGSWNLDPEIAGYIKSFHHWWNLDINVITIEERFYCDELMITGKVDLILDTKDGLTIFDFKTSAKPSKTWPLQGAAYAHMARKSGYDIKNIQFLHLKKDGSPPDLISYDDQYELFKKCYDVYNVFFKKKRRKAA